MHCDDEYTGIAGLGPGCRRILPRDPGSAVRVWVKLDDYDGPAGPCRTLEDMTEDEILALENLYGVPVRRPHG